MDPLYALAFLQTFVDILQEYFGSVSAAMLRDNFDIVYQVRADRVVCYLINTWYAASRGNVGRGRPPVDNFPQCIEGYRSATYVIGMVLTPFRRLTT